MILFRPVPPNLAYPTWLLVELANVKKPALAPLGIEDHIMVPVADKDLLEEHRWEHTICVQLGKVLGNAHRSYEFDFCEDLLTDLYIQRRDDGKNPLRDS